MNKPKDRMPIDSNGYWYGCCEIYYENGELDCKGVCFHGDRNGYFEDYDGIINKDYTGYYLNHIKISKDNKQGYCYTWNKQEL
jgi:hypothetical protein